MARKRRALRADAYLRLWTYLSRADQVYVMCWFAAMHDELVSRGSILPPLVRRLVDVVLDRLGLAGAVISVALDIVEAIRASDVVNCDRTLREQLNGGT